ncbi:MAG: Na+/H+ antiporter NhaA [Deltaproteobacteria bacterium]|nr:Na+/H+ antiporter NhaA [Deltaproteobacteria bacterium]
MSGSVGSRPGPLTSSPPEAWAPLWRLGQLASRPVDRFLRIEAASGILLFLAAAIALGWANSPWSESYWHLWHTPIGLKLGGFQFERDLEWFVNDALMVIFFFVVGMEIRREIYDGALSGWRRAALPTAAALGGMAVPAGIYLALAGAPPTHAGWGVPMATDIAFAVGVLAILGPRVPNALRILLLALAVIDDLGAIVVIAIFYSTGVSVTGFAVAAGGFVAIFAMQGLGVRAKLAYIAPAIVAWGGIYSAGVHPTIAGVIVGLITPVRAWLGPDGFVDGVRKEIETVAATDFNTMSSHDFSTALRHVNVARREAISPSEQLTVMLHPWVAFVIMPIFALANAGVTLGGVTFDGTATRVALGAGLGLILGKPIGVLLMCGLTLRLGVATLPEGIGRRHLMVLGLVAGIGFTMALFIAQLAFEDAAFLAAAKLGVLGASVVTAILGLLVGRVLLGPVDSHAGEATDEGNLGTTATAAAAAAATGGDEA